MTTEKHQCSVCGLEGIAGETIWSVAISNKWFCANHKAEAWESLCDPDGHIKVSRIALSQCIQVNPDNPLAVAETIKEAFEALEELISVCREVSYTHIALTQAKAVLAKVNKKGE